MDDIQLNVGDRIVWNVSGRTLGGEYCVVVKNDGITVELMRQCDDGKIYTVSHDEMVGKSRIERLVGKVDEMLVESIKSGDSFLAKAIEKKYEVQKMNDELFKVGDEVECLIWGNGVVKSIDLELHYGITVSFSNGFDELYTFEGCIDQPARRTLYHRGTVKVVEVEKPKTATLADGSKPEDKAYNITGERNNLCMGHLVNVGDRIVINGEELNVLGFTRGEGTFSMHMITKEHADAATACGCDEVPAFEGGIGQQATLADGSTAVVGQEVWHPEYGKLYVSSSGGLFHEDKDGVAPCNIQASDCYPRPCACLADGSVIMEGEKCWHPVYDEMNVCHAGDGNCWNASVYDKIDGWCRATLGECYPLGSRVVTPEEMAEMEEERDKWKSVAKVLVSMGAGGMAESTDQTIERAMRIVEAEYAHR